jgi:gamma-glutamyltranspeptidase / glutathione hydrolase
VSAGLVPTREARTREAETREAHTREAHTREARKTEWASRGARRRERLRLGPIFVALGAGLFLLRTPRLQAQGLGAAVATENATASREAFAVLRAGGSAVDAAITAALVAGVSSPSSSGLGGGGFALAYDAAQKKLSALDFREAAPRALDPAPFEARPLPDANRGALVGVPGELAGLVELHRQGGRLPLSSLLARAEARARDGFFVSPHLAKALSTGRDKVSLSPYLKALYYAGDKPAWVGKRQQNPRLADTLALLRSEGPEVFYTGKIAENLSKLVQAHQGQLRVEDFRDYRVIWREPLCRPYEGRRVCTMPAPSAGGLLLLEVLGLFSSETLRLLGHGTPAYQHLLAEGMRGALLDRMIHYGDPAFTPVSQDALLSEARLQERRSRIALDRTHSVPTFKQFEHGTHHLVVRDRQGNVVSLTTTINRMFGSALVDETTGIVLNDQLDDFAESSSAEHVGLAESPNRARPLARPVSSMTPTLVFEGDEVVAALGGSGGLAIGINVTQVLLSALVFGHSAKLAVSAPRFFVPFGGKTLLLEGEPSDAHLADLAFRGEVTAKVPQSSSAVQLVVVRDGAVSAASDPRKYGEALTEP